MTFAPGQIVDCYHRGRVRTRERFAQVQVTGQVRGRDRMYFVQPAGGGCHSEFIAFAEDLGDLDTLKQCHGVEPARTDVLAALVAPEPQLSLFG